MTRKMVLFVGLVCMGWGLVNVGSSSGQQSGTMRPTWPDFGFRISDFGFRISRSAFHIPHSAIWDAGRGSWTPLEGIVRTEDRRVVARSDRMGMFALGLAKAAFASDFSELRIYPNPFKPNDGFLDTGTCNGGVTIDRLPKLRSIEIYNVSGTLVATMGKAIVYDMARDVATWKCANDDGEVIVSGIYIVAMENQEGKQRTAKIGVIK